MDEDTKWLHSTLERFLPEHSLTLWRGVTPLTGWWLVVCAKGSYEWTFTVRHETVAERNDAALARAVSAKTLVPP